MLLQRYLGFNNVLNPLAQKHYTVFMEGVLIGRSSSVSLVSELLENIQN